LNATHLWIAHKVYFEESEVSRELRKFPKTPLSEEAKKALTSVEDPPIEEYRAVFSDIFRVGGMLSYWEFWLEEPVFTGTDQSMLYQSVLITLKAALLTFYEDAKYIAEDVHSNRPRRSDEPGVSAFRKYAAVHRRGVMMASPLRLEGLPVAERPKNAFNVQLQPEQLRMKAMEQLKNIWHKIVRVMLPSSAPGIQKMITSFTKFVMLEAPMLSIPGALHQGVDLLTIMLIHSAHDIKMQDFLLSLCFRRYMVAVLEVPQRDTLPNTTGQPTRKWNFYKTYVKTIQCWAVSSALVSGMCDAILMCNGMLTPSNYMQMARKQAMYVLNIVDAFCDKQTINVTATHASSVIEIFVSLHCRLTRDVITSGDERDTMRERHHIHNSFISAAAKEVAVILFREYDVAKKLLALGAKLEHMPQIQFLVNSVLENFYSPDHGGLIETMRQCRPRLA
jgi:hypothetical protein